MSSDSSDASDVEEQVDDVTEEERVIYTPQH